METRLIDGKAFAETLRGDIARRVAVLKADKDIVPGLAVVLVGSDPASEVYVKNKGRQTQAAGMNSFEFKLPDTATQEELLAQVEALNQDAAVNGILVQLPLPGHIDEEAVIGAIAPEKDVDGFHVINAGKLATGQDGFVPCTPLGCLMLLKDYFASPSPLEGEGRGGGIGSMDFLSKTTPHPNPPPQGGRGLSGLHAVIVGRSNIVGKPMAALLLQQDCTVTIAHSRTQNLPDLVKTADIVVAAVGRPEMIKGSWIKPGAVVIDVGINRIATADGKTRLVGDVAFGECQGIAGAITPVPGGVGPMTIACLLENTYRACLLQNGLES
jgi:methylenetetrahydrofolate dehydrogenase (NADP+)/methenyltetrahydrofolate cyclohydrolase